MGYFDGKSLEGIDTEDKFIDATMDTVRLFLRDNEDYNILFEGEEFTDKNEYIGAMQRAFSTICSIPPMIPFTWEHITGGNTIFQNFCRITASKLLETEALRQFRNEVNSSETNTSSGILDKADRYKAYSDAVAQPGLEYFNSLVDKMNTLQAFGGTFSTNFFFHQFRFIL